MENESGGKKISWGPLSEEDSRAAEEYLRNHPEFNYKAWKNRERGVIGKDLNGRAMKLFIEYKNRLVGAEAAQLERERDSRFLTAAALLLEFMGNDDLVVSWLDSPCGCRECKNLSENLLRHDLVNSEYGFQHLLRLVDLARNRYAPSQVLDFSINPIPVELL